VSNDGSGYNYIEYPVASPQVDTDATLLAVVGSTPVAAAAEIGLAARSILGPSYAYYYYPGQNLRSGNADRLLEQAVVWAADTKDKADNYLIQANAGDTLTISTTTPGDGEFEPVQRPRSHVELYAPDNTDTPVAADDNSASDGRNVLLVHTADQTGAYLVRVTAAAGSGDYTLIIQGATGAATPTLAVTSASVADGASEHLSGISGS